LEAISAPNDAAASDVTDAFALLTHRMTPNGAFMAGSLGTRKLALVARASKVGARSMA